MIIYPDLPYLYQHDGTKRCIVDIYYDGMTHGTEVVAKYGTHKAVYAKRTKRYRPGKIFSINPWDVRSVTGVQHKSSGAIFRYSDLKKPVVSWNGTCLSASQNSYWNNYVNVRCPFEEEELDAILLHNIAKISTPQADYGMMLGELTETLAMIMNPLQGIRKILKSVFRHKLLKKTNVSHLSSQWLEIRYGIMPLISDIEALRKEVKKRYMGHLHRVSTRWCLDRTRVLSEYNWNPCTFSGLWVKGEKLDLDERYMSVHSYYRPKLDFILTGGTVYDIPSLLWELTPFSFVLDWFVDIGTWLRAMQPKPDIEMQGSTIYISRTKTHQIDTIWACNQPGTTPVTSVQGDRYSVVENQGYRIVNHSLPTKPLVNVDLTSLYRKVDAFTLTWQKTAKYLR